MPSLLVDTHILIWWRTNPGRLSKPQIQTLSELDRDRQPLSISAITLRELAVLGQRGRLQIATPWDAWLDEVSSSPLIDVLPLTAAIAAESVRLGPDFPRDPADQIIVATARCHGLRLMTADESIRRWGKVLLI